jgi:pyruvate,orthophosphate dikinase
MADRKYVYFFGDGKADGGSKMRNELGGKGANLAEMVNIILPVPAGFTITTEVCTWFYANDRKYPPELKDQVRAALQKVEKVMGAEFGSKQNPLLVSCRSGARESMPGMMDTVLNIGLTDETVQALAKQSGDERFAWDSYRRLVQMYGDVVMELKPQSKNDPDLFEEVLEQAKHKAKVHLDKDLTAAQLKDIVGQYKALIRKHTAKDFPQDPMEQLWGCIGAVFGSWMNDRAIVYRRQYGIPHEWGTAVNVQVMVFQPGRRLRHGCRADPRLCARRPRVLR